MNPYSHARCARALVAGLAVPALVVAVAAGAPLPATVAAATASTTGLVAAYSFDEGSGTSAGDASGNGNSGTLTGAVWSSAGKNAGALSFDGVNDLVSVADAAALDLTTGMTLEAWVKPAGLGSIWRTVVIKEQPGQLAYALYAHTDANKPSGHVYVGGDKDARGGGPLPVNAWSHLAATFDGSTLRLYVNGALVASRGVAGSIVTSGSPLRIGGNTVWGEWFAGLIDDVRVYSRALPASEIQTDMNTPVGGAAPPPPPPPPPAPTGLVAAFSFDEGTGSVAGDASGNGNSGTLNGAVWTTAGRNGGAVSFDGVDDMVSVADDATLDLVGSMTLEAWVKPTALGSMWRTVVLKEQPGHLVYALYAHTDTNNPSGHVFVGGDDPSARGTGPLPLGSWSHLAATYDGALLHLYVNGAQVASRAVTGSMPTSGSPLRIGGNAVWAEWFAGVIDDVRVYGRALSASEIQTDMNTPVGGSASPPPSGDTMPPSTPANLAKTGETTSSITVGWSPSTDDVGVTGYGLYRDGAGAGSTTATSHTFSGLVCGTTYTLAVDAFDAAGNRSAPASLLAATSGCPTGGGADVFVSPAGSDLNPCTQAAPCRSFDRAYRVAAPGQVVEAAGGTYAGQTINVDSAKTSTTDVVFRPAAGAAVTVTGQVTVYGNHVELRDMAFNGGWATMPGSDDVTFRRIDAKHLFVNSSTNVSVLGGSVGPTLDYDSQIKTYNFTNPTASRNVLVDGVYFHDATLSAGSDAHVECLQIYGSENVTVRNSRFFNCAHHDIFIDGEPFSTLRNITLENNMGDRVRAGFYSFRAGSPGTCENVVFRYNSSPTPMFIGCTGGTGNRFVGNVGPMSQSICRSWVTYSHNVWSGATCGSTDLNAPSGFRDPANFDLHLAPGSAAIDRGNPADHPAVDIDGQARPIGGAPDAGADEAA